MNPEAKRDLSFAIRVAALVALALFWEPFSRLPDRVFTTADLLQGHPVLALADAGAPRNQLLSDPVVEFVPWLEFSRAELAEGRFPLWNPYNGCGVPHWANFQSAVLSPFSLPFYVLPLKWALLASAFLKSFVAGAALLLFLRTLGLSKTASAFGAVAFQASGHNALLLSYPHSGVIACVPAALLCVEKLISGGGLRKWSAGLVASLVAMAYSGHPETLFFGALTVAAYTLCRLLPQLRERCGCTLRLAGRIGALALAAVLVSMPLVLPFFEYVQQSPRAFGLESTTHVALDVSHWPRYLFPNYLGTPVDGLLVDARRPPPNYEIANLGYVGWLVLTLALLALPAALRSSRAVSFALTALVWPLWAHDALGMASGASAWLGLGFIPSYVSQGAWALATAVLSAHAVQGLLEARSSRTWSTSVLAAGLACLFLARSHALDDLAPALDASNHAAYTGAEHVFWITLSALLVGIALSCAVWIRARFLRVLATLALFAGLFFQNVQLFARYQIAVDERLVYPQTPAVETLQREVGTGRVLFVDPLGIPPHANLMYGLAVPTSYDALGLAEYNRLLGLLVEPKSAWQVATKASAHALAVLGVTHVVLPNSPAGLLPPCWEGPSDSLERIADLPSSVLYRFTATRGRFWLAPHAEARPGPRKALFRTAELDVDPYTTAIIGPVVPEGFVARRADAPIDLSAAKLSLDLETPTLVRLTIESDAPSYLIAALTRYPGWIATLDGAPAPLLDANTAFMGLDLPAGRHEVELRYDPTSLRDGLWLAALGASIAVGLVLLRARVRAASA